MDDKDALELARLRGQMDVLLANRRSAYSSGFFGCSGVFGAIVAMVCVMLIIAKCSDSDRPSAVMAGTAEPRKYLALCVPAIMDAEERFKGITRANGLAEMPEVKMGSEGPVITCTAGDVDGRLVLQALVHCEDPLQRRCATAVSAWRDGKLLPYR